MRATVIKILKKLKLMSAATCIFNRFSQATSSFKWKKIKTQERIFLELGSGAKKGKNGWVTIDLSGADISHNLSKGIPLPDATVDRIYTSHLLEHIPYRELVIFLNECFRVLKIGGELSVCVPNAGLYIRAYTEGRQFKSDDMRYKPALIDTGSSIDQINYIAYMDQQHKYMFDEENLINTLKKAAFTTVELRGFDEKIDLKARDFESIYAIAIK